MRVSLCRPMVAAGVGGATSSEKAPSGEPLIEHMTCARTCPPKPISVSLACGANPMGPKGRTSPLFGRRDEYPAGVCIDATITKVRM